MRLRMSRELSVSEACGLLGVTKQAWYGFFKRSFKEALDEDRILECVRFIREDLPGLGVRKMKERLKKEFRLDIGRDRLFDIMSRNNLLIRPRVRRTRTTFSDHGLHVYPDLRKDFAPDGIDRLWVSDITYIWIEDEKKFYYLFLITDAYSKKIVGWEIADNMRHENAIAALKMALKQCRRSQRPIHHSDKGLQYCAKPYVEMIRRRHIEISMTEGYDPRNNGIAERVNGILKEEFLKYMDVRKDNIRQVLETVINTYHTRRPHLSLGMLTPDEVHRGAVPGRKLWKKYYLKTA